MKYYNFETMFISLKNKLVEFLEGCASVLANEVLQSFTRVRSKTPL